MLARIVLAEQFEIKPVVVPMMTATLDQMLEKADAGLLAGDSFLRYHHTHLCSIDLAELWAEMTDLPFVHGIFCTWLESTPSSDLEFFGSLGERIEQKHRLKRSVDPGPFGPDQQLLDKYLRSVSYQMNEDVREGILEFLHYAHYHGMIPDIPELRFASPG
jgi:predicted solute-binding protein